MKIYKMGVGIKHMYQLGAGDITTPEESESNRQYVL